jgi:hypothetical protein
MTNKFEGITRIKVTELQAIFLSQDENTILRDNHGDRIKYLNQWYFYNTHNEMFMACYEPRLYGGGTYYRPPDEFFLCDK